MQPAFIFQASTQGGPVKTGLLGHIAQSQHHALFHAFEAAHIEVSARILQRLRQIGRSLAHEVLHITLGLARGARKREMDFNEILGQVLQGAKVRQFLLRTRTKKERELAPLELA